MDKIMLLVVGGALAILCIGVPAVFMIIALFMASERRIETPPAAPTVYHVTIDARSYTDARAVTVQPAAPAPVYWYPRVDAGELGAGAPSQILELDAGEPVYMPTLRRRELPAGEVQNARVR